MLIFLIVPISSKVDKDFWNTLYNADHQSIYSGCGCYSNLESFLFFLIGLNKTVANIDLNYLPKIEQKSSDHRKL